MKPQLNYSCFFFSCPIPLFWFLRNSVHRVNRILKRILLLRYNFVIITQIKYVITKLCYINFNDNFIIIIINHLLLYRGFNTKPINVLINIVWALLNVCLYLNVIYITTEKPSSLYNFYFYDFFNN